MNNFVFTTFQLSPQSTYKGSLLPYGKWAKDDRGTKLRNFLIQGPWLTQNTIEGPIEL
jgi:hypothetical protein